MATLEIALAQLRCEDGDIPKNVERLDDVVNNYGSRNDLIIFPESFLTGFNTRDTAKQLAQPIDGPLVQHLTAKAKANDITIAAGFYELDGDNVYNTTVLAAPSGLLFAYRKTHLWKQESAMVDAGDSYYSCDWKDTRIGALICYDIEFPETARVLATLGTELLIVTDGNMAPYGPVHRIALQARAVENHMFVAMANRVGGLTSQAFDSDTQFVGESVIVDPYGTIIAEAGHDEEVLMASLDLSLISKSKRYYNYLHERRISLDVTIEGQANGLQKARLAQA